MLKHGLLNVHAWGGGGLTVIRQKKMLISKHIILCYQIFWRKMQKFKISWQINQGGLSRDCTVDDTLMVICTTDCTVGDTLWHTWTAGNYWWKIQSIFDTDSRRKLLGNFSWKILIFFSIFHEKFLNNFPLGTLHRLYLDSLPACLQVDLKSKMLADIWCCIPDLQCDAKLPWTTFKFQCNFHEISKSFEILSIYHARQWKVKQKVK